MASHFDNVPGTEVGVDFFREFGALGPQVLYLRADINLVISANQPQLLDFDLQLGNGLLKVQVIGIHAWSVSRGWRGAQCTKLMQRRPIA